MDQTSLDLLLAFLNSHDLHGTDDWFVPGRFQAWALGAGAGGSPDASDAEQEALLLLLRRLAGSAAPSAGEVAAARDVRDAMLALLLEGDDGFLLDLDELVQALPVRLRVSPGGGVALEAVGTGPVSVATAALAAAHDAMADGTWARLRLCRGEDCHWAFVDRSRNGSRAWCSMADCGARAKARAYRARKRAAAGGGELSAVEMVGPEGDQR